MNVLNKVGDGAADICRKEHGGKSELNLQVDQTCTIVHCDKPWNKRKHSK